GWFKYYGFVSINANGAFASLGLASPLPLVQVTLPVGISFFTFMGISYVVDVYRRVITPAPALDFAVYLSFFPHLVAGPVVRGAGTCRSRAVCATTSTSRLEDHGREGSSPHGTCSSRWSSAGSGTARRGRSSPGALSTALARWSSGRCAPERPSRAHC